MASDMTQVDASMVQEDRYPTVIALLPASVQNRFGPLRHIRRSFSLSNIRGPAVSTPQALSSRPRSEGNATPPVSLEPLPPAADVAVQQDLQLARQEDHSSTCAVDRAAKDRFARQGAQLIGVSMTGQFPLSSSGVGEFERDAYVDGLAYLLRGLPENLTQHERDRLLRSMPGDILPHKLEQDSPTQASAIYRLTSSLVLRLIFAFSIILPYVLLALQWLANMERKYKVSETVGHYALQSTNSIVTHAGHILQASRGHEWRVGQMLLSRLLWTVEEVSRGVADGLDQGLSGVRAQQLR